MMGIELIPAALIGIIILIMILYFVILLLQVFYSIFYLCFQNAKIMNRKYKTQLYKDIKK